MTSEPRVKDRARPAVSEGNRAAIEAEVRRTMGVVGIGARYHDARLREWGETGGRLWQTILDTWPQTIRTGAGVTFFGDDPVLGDMLMMTAKAYHLAGKSVRVVGLMELAEELRAGEDELDGQPLDEVGALFIPEFQGEDPKCPLMPYQRAMVQELVTRRLANNRAVLPWLIGRPSWWSRSVLVRMGEKNTFFEATQ